MAFLDGPFSMQPQRRNPGLFNQPYSPAGAGGMGSSNPPSGPDMNPMRGDGGLPSSPIRGGPVMGPPITASGGGAQKIFPVNSSGSPPPPPAPTPSPNPTPTNPTPYAYSGPSMSLLTNAQAAGAAVPPPAPVPAGNSFMNNMAPFMRRMMMPGGDGGVMPMMGY